MNIPAAGTEKFYEFGEFRLLPAERLLLCDRQPVQLPPKVFDTLLVLVERGGHLVEKDFLLKTIWADSFVEEATLTRNISILRKVLGETGDGQKYIETVPKRGYRFTKSVVEKRNAPEPVEKKAPVETEPPAAAPPRTHRPVLWLTLVFTIVIGVFASLSFLKAPPRADVRSIAVLPFKQIGAGERDRALELGMADATITRLGKIRQVVVRPTGAISKYLEDETDAVQAGKNLQTDAVLEGTIQRDEERVRVTARLIKIADGSQIWSQTFNVRLTDIFSVQDSISAQITESLNLELSGDEKKSLARRETVNPEAYRSYLKGRYFWNKRTPEGLSKALEHFERAKELDPNYALAYAGLAESYVLLGEYRLMLAGDAFSKARVAADKALEIDSQLAEARGARAYILAFYDWNFQGAEREFKLAIEHNPNYPTVHQWYAEFLQALGRFEESLAEYRRAEENDPLSLIVKTGIAGHFYTTRQYDRSIEQSNKILELEPNFGWAYGFLWLSSKEKGQFAEAVEAHLKAEQIFGRPPEEMEVMRQAFARAGWKAYWLKWLEFANNSKRWQAVDKAGVYALAGDKEKALELLEQSYAARERWILNIKTAPIFDPLRDDPRFAALVARVGLN